MGEEIPDASRFQRIDESAMIGTSHVRHYSSIGASTSDSVSRIWASFSNGDFLSRIWALYGPPDRVVFEGFSYVFRDSQTGLVFTAYSVGSGPGFGRHQITGRPQGRPVIFSINVYSDSVR
jgi:hypothetical protein